MCGGGQGGYGGSGAEEGDRPVARGYGSGSHLLGHLVDPRGGAVAQVRTPRVPRGLLRQALERSDAWRRAESEEKKQDEGEVMER